MECGGGKRLQIGNRLVTLLLQELHHFGRRAIGLRCDMLPVHLIDIRHRDGRRGRAFDHHLHPGQHRVMNGADMMGRHPDRPPFGFGHPAPLVGWALFDKGDEPLVKVLKAVR